MMKYVTIKVLARESGLSEDAIRAKKKNGIWLEGVHWQKAPDGRIYFNREAIERWVEGIVA